MAVELIIAPEVEQDFAEAYAWYEARRTGLDEEFLSCVDAGKVWHTKIWSKGKVMETQTITIRVSPEAARVYNTATDEQQRKLEALLSLKLTEVARTTRPLEDIMSGMSHRAQARGLTPEILESLLNE